METVCRAAHAMAQPRVRSVVITPDVGPVPQGAGMQRRILTVLAAVLLVLGLGAGPALARPAAATDEPVAYLALGDSYGSGYQPGSGDDLAGGYAGRVLDAFAALAPGAQLTNLSCGGETVESYRDGGRFCSYEGSQREAALAFLTEHPETRLVTLSLGGNNVQTCVSGSGSVDLACVQQGPATARSRSADGVMTSAFLPEVSP